MKSFLTALLVLFTATAYAGELKPYSGAPLPDFTLQDRQGSSHRLSQYRGKVVMVNFWATYCTPCIKEMPSMQRLKEKMNGRDFVILAVDMAEEAADVVAFLARYNIKVDFPILFDTEARVIEQWMISAVPTSFILDKRGTIRYALYGGIEWDRTEVIELLDPLLNE